MRVKTGRRNKKFSPVMTRRNRMLDKLLALALIAMTLLSVLPDGVINAQGGDAGVTVDSFGEYPETAEVPFGTSRADAAAALPANIPAAVVTGQAEPYSEDIPVTWNSDPVYDGTAGTYRFTADAGEKTDGGWPAYTVVVSDAAEETAAAGEYEITAAPGTEITALGLPGRLPVTVTPEPETDGAEIPVIWSGGDYDPETPGTYIFTAAFAEDGWKYAGNMPAASVTVLESDPPSGEEAPEENRSLVFAFDGLLSVSKTEHSGFASYTAEEQQQIFLADIRVTDESGNAVDDVFVNFGSFDIEADPGTVYTVLYSAHHPETLETFTAEREVQITDGGEPDGLMTAADGGIGILTVYDGTCGDGITWRFDTATGILTISGDGPMADYHNNPPWHEYRDSAGPHHFCPDVKEIVIEEGVTHIGSYAFPVFRSLTSVTIPSSVESIGSYAFRDATIITAINIPDSVTRIGEGAFRDNHSLVSVNIPQNLRVISASTFASCLSLASIVIPVGVESVENDAFGGCEQLDVVVFKSTVPPAQRAFNGLPIAGKFYYPSTADEAEWKAWASNVDGIKSWDLAPDESTNEIRPRLSGGTAARKSGSTAEISFVSSEAGTYYYAVVADGAEAPVINTDGMGTACGAGDIVFDFSELGAGDVKDIYIVLKDADGNRSDPIKIDIPNYLTAVSVRASSGGNVITGNGSAIGDWSWETGLEQTLTAVPPAGYHFESWTVTGAGSSVNTPGSATATLKIGTGATMVEANFAANTVTLYIRLDGNPYIRYGDRFWLVRNGTQFFAPDAYDANSATEIFSGIPDGTYTVYAGVSETSSAATDVPLTVSGGGSAIVNYYTLTLSAAPSAAGTVSGGGIFLSGTKAQIEATETNGVFKRWTTNAGGTFDDAADADTGYTVTGTAALTAYFMQTGGGAGLTVTPPVQNQKKIPADGQEIKVSADTALGEGDSDGTEISELYWFRERVNNPLPRITDQTVFEERYDAADPDHDRGVIALGGFGGSEDTAEAAIPADKNGRYWFMTTFSSGGASVIKIDYADIKNIFTPYEVLVKHTVTAEEAPDAALDNSLDYFPITNTLGGSPGIPYDLNSADVVTGLPAGLDYDSVTIEGLAAYSGTAPSYAGAYDFYAAGKAKDTPFTLKMNGAFLSSNSDCDGGNPQLYTVRYVQDTSMWVTLRAFRVDPAGNELKTDENIPDGVRFKHYQDFAAPLDASESSQISNFKDEGGSFIPREVQKWENQIVGGNILTWEPVGWYIASEEVDFSADFDPFADQTIDGITYHAENDWKDFDPTLTLAGNSVNEDTPYWPLANNERLYLVCYGGTGTARVWEEYYLFIRDEESGSGRTGDPLGKEATFDLLNPDEHDYSRTTGANDVAGYVAVGYRIVKAEDWETVKSLPRDHQDSLANNNPAVLLRNPPDDPRQGMWGSVTVTIAGDDLKDVAGAKYGNRPHVVYYYAPDANGNGIPDCGEYAITLNYIGLKPDGTETVLKTGYLRPRLDPIGTQEANATTIYVGLDGRMYWTADHQLPELDVTDITDAGQRNGVDLGDQYTRIPVQDSEAAWLFRPGENHNQLIPVPIPTKAGSVLTLNFYFDYATDGVNKDAGKYIDEYYRSVPAPGAPLPDVANTTSYVLVSEAYDKNIPAQPGYLTVGWYAGGDFPGVTPDGEESEIEALKQLPAFRREDRAHIDPNRAELTADVTFIYSLLGDDLDGDGLSNGGESAKGGNPFVPDTDGDGIPDGWEADNGLDPGDGSDAKKDADNDGLDNKGEFDHTTDPHDPDTDGDGLPDGWEVKNDLNPNDPDDAGSDPDGDDWTNTEEYNGGRDSSDPQVAEKRLLSFDANGGRHAPDPVMLPSGGNNYTVTLPGAGAMRREGYVFANWCLDPNGHGTLYWEGDSFTLNRINGKKYEGEGAAGSGVTLYAVWDIAPRVELLAPFIEPDRSVTLDGRITRTLYNYNFMLDYKKADEPGGWSLLDSGQDVSDNRRNISLTLPSGTFLRDTRYEVRLTAINTNGGQQASVTQFFRISDALGNGTVTGEVKNDTEPGSVIDVTVFLQSSNITIQSIKLTGIAYGQTIQYTFTGVADGWYSVVAHDGEYMITRDVYMKDDVMNIPPEVISFDKGKTQTLVVTEAGSPVITAEYLPELFNDPGIYTETDQTSVVDRDGTVEIRLEGSAIDSGDQAILNRAAADDGFDRILFEDLSVFKTRRDENERIIDNHQLQMTFPILLRITIATEGRWIKKVYRIHNGVTEEWSRGVQNSDGEYFEQRDAESVVLYMKKFSGYALAEGDAYTVTAETDASGGGTVTSGAGTYFELDPVSVTAKANPGYMFIGWTITEGGITLENPNASVAVFTMPAQAVTLRANFVKIADANQFIITASAGMGGTISPSGDIAVPPGGSETFTFTPDAGYHISGILVNGTPLTGTLPNTYTFYGVDGAQTISVSFEQDAALPSPGTEPGENTNTGETSADIPMTGDSGNISVLFSALLISALAIMILCFYSKPHSPNSKRH